MNNALLQTTMSALLFLCLFGMTACVESGLENPQEEIMSGESSNEQSADRYQPENDPYYQSDKDLLVSTLNISEEQAGYDVRILRASGVEGLKEITSATEEYEDSFRLLLVDVHNNQYELFYTVEISAQGIATLQRVTPGDGERTVEIIFRSYQHHSFISDEDWSYYYLDNEPQGAPGE